MFYLGGVGLAFFLNLLLLSKSKKTTADIILAGWLLVITLHLLLFYFRHTWQYSQILGADMPMPLMHGPFLYWYTRALTNHNLSLKVVLIHFLPALVVLIYLIPFFTIPPEQKITVFKNEGAGYETFNLIKLLAIIVSGVLYVIVSSLALRKHRLSIVHQFSSTENINLQWLQYLIYWIGAIWLLVIVGNDDLVFTAAVLFISFIGFFGIRQMGIFHSPILSNIKESDLIIAEEIEPDAVKESQLESEVIQPETEQRKYKKSGLSSDESKVLHHHLTLLMSNEKPFRESELSLMDLATRLNTQPNYLSQVINEREGKNFYDYVNTMRIGEFKRLALSPDSRRYTLLALAQQCGFNSKSSFNRYCKKVNGKSPSELLLTLSDAEK